MERYTGEPEATDGMTSGVTSGGSDETAWRRNALRLNLGSTAMIVLIAGWAVLATWFEPWTWLRVVGMAMYVVSAALIVVARAQLGAAYTTGAEARQLVTTGLYSRIRNPIYVFAVPGVAGLFLFLNKPWYFLGFLVVIPVQIVRIRRERKVLTETFGDAYVEYRKRTWF